MGYTTTFTGQVKIEPSLTLADYTELKRLNEDTQSVGPGGYCQWEPAEDGARLVWDGGEKFYDYTEWMQYICDLLTPRGYKLNGVVNGVGEDGALCRVTVADSVVSYAEPKVSWE